MNIESLSQLLACLFQGAMNRVTADSIKHIEKLHAQYGNPKLEIKALGIKQVGVEDGFVVWGDPTGARVTITFGK